MQKLTAKYNTYRIPWEAEKNHTKENKKPDTQIKLTTGKKPKQKGNHKSKVRDEITQKQSFFYKGH